MSRTFKTDPLWVRMENHKDHRVRVSEVHNHDNGECTLPANVREQINVVELTPCHYMFETHNNARVISGDTGGSRLMALKRKRAERHQAKREVRSLDKDAPTEDQIKYDMMWDVLFEIYEDDDLWGREEK